MTGTTVNLAAIPTGGACTLAMTDYASTNASGVMVISRAVSGVAGLSTFTQLYSGAPLAYYVDPGEYSPGPLIAASGYVYAVTDLNGTTQVGPVYPAQTIPIKPDGMTSLFVWLLQGSIANLTYPAGIAPPPSKVTTEMPKRGFPPLPFIVVNLDLLAQRFTQIGQDVPNPNIENQWVQPIFVDWRWRVTVLGNNSRERDFFRDAVITTWTSLQSSVFANIGMNTTHDFMANSWQIADFAKQSDPGFYGADVMCHLTGVFNAMTLTNFPFIEQIDGTIISDVDEVTTTIQVPRTKP